MTGATNDSSLNIRDFPILRLVAGLVIVLAGLLVYLKVNLGLSFAVVFVLAGLAVVVIGFLGHRARGPDIAILVISLVVFAGAASSYNYSTTSTHSYSATRSEVTISTIMINATTRFGGIAIKFSGNADLGYVVTFNKTAYEFPFFLQPFGNSSTSFTNVTSHGALILNAYSSTDDITVTVGPGYLVDINASAGTDSVDINSNSPVQRFGQISLSTGTGSISTNIDATNISNLNLQDGTGNISLVSNYFSPSGPHVPVTVSTGTGSLNFNVAFLKTAGVSLSASNGFGSISKNLPGFAISQSTNNALKASAGNQSGPSFDVSLSVGTGSMNVDTSLVSPLQ